MMGMHVQGIDGKVIRRKMEGLKNLFQGEIFPVSENYDILQWGSAATKRGDGGPLTFGYRFIFDLMKRSRCFWFMLLE